MTKKELKERTENIIREKELIERVEGKMKAFQLKTFVKGLVLEIVDCLLDDVLSEMSKEQRVKKLIVKKVESCPEVREEMEGF